MAEINTNKPISKVTVDGVEVELKGASGEDMLQAMVDATNSCRYLFYNYDGTTLDISRLDTSNVVNMENMFNNCSNLTELDLSNFNTSKVTSMQAMFGGCSNLTELDLSGFDTKSNSVFMAMFNNCSNLIKINGTLNIVGTSNISNMFNKCTNLQSFTLKNIKIALTIGSGTSYGTLLDDPTIINTAMELWDLTGATSQKLTVATPVSAKLDTIYVKLITATDNMIVNDPNINSKKPCEVCQSTDDGAMTLREYIVSKNWTISG